VRRFAGTPLFLSETVRRCDEDIFAVNSSAICYKIAEVSVEKNQFLTKRNKFKQVHYLTNTPIPLRYQFIWLTIRIFLPHGDQWYHILNLFNSTQSNPPYHV
jgi:hypothetical protein